MELDTATIGDHPTFVKKDMEQVEVRNETVGEVAVCEGAVCEVAVSEARSNKEESESRNEVAVREGAVSGVREELTL